MDKSILSNLTSYCEHLLKNSYDRHNLAEEIVQRALLKVVRSGRLTRGEPYLKRAVHNEFVSYVRESSREQKVLDVSTNLAGLPAYTHDNSSANSSTIKLPHKLPKNGFRILYGIYWKGKSRIEIARELGIKKRTLDKILVKCKKKIKKEMIILEEIC